MDFNVSIYSLCRYDVGKDKFLDLQELKYMMEKLGSPQTHLGLKDMIKQVDEDLDQKMSFREVNSCFTSLSTSIILLD